MLSIYMAWLNRRFPNPEDMPIQSWTLLASLQDFSQPGEIEVFLDEDTVSELTRMMTRRGYLEGKEMGTAFRMLRSNSLIWHYVVHKYLYGETPPPLDVLFWNTDSTRMPATMHSYYLRELYINNSLIETDALTIAGQPIDLNRIIQPLYAVSAEDDHIAPWRATFRVANFVSSPVRYVLSSSGHILGIINPPVKPPKRVYWAGPARRGDDPGSWKASGAQMQGSWWPDWMAWLAPQCGPMVAPPPLGNDQCPVMGEAPGRYVLEQ
jgi:polyhydroxyalkanoate synthase subunit PhaC